MSLVYLSYDLSSETEPSMRKARKAFRQSLKECGWAARIGIGSSSQKLPDTTLCAHRDAQEALSDFEGAVRAGKAEDANFKVTKHILILGARIGSDSDDKRARSKADKLLTKAR